MEPSKGKAGRKEAEMFKGISKKQAGVIYGNWKRGNLVATEATIHDVYDHVDMYTQHVQSWQADMVNALRGCIDAIFANDYETAQAQLDRFATIRDIHLAA